MPIGKDSITKRVAKQTEAAPAKNEEKIAPELVATTAAAPTEKKPAAKKSASTSTTKKTTSTAKKTTTAKKSAATETKAPKAEVVKETLTPPTTAPEKKVDTTVLANVAPETVEAVIGHKEKEAVEIVQIGGKMPTHLL